MPERLFFTWNPSGNVIIAQKSGCLTINKRPRATESIARGRLLKKQINDLFKVKVVLRQVVVTLQVDHQNNLLPCVNIWEAASN